MIDAACAQFPKDNRRSENLKAAITRNGKGWPRARLASPQQPSSEYPGLPKIKCLGIVAGRGGSTRKLDSPCSRSGRKGLHDGRPVWWCQVRSGRNDRATCPVPFLVIPSSGRSERVPRILDSSGSGELEHHDVAGVKCTLTRSLFEAVHESRSISIGVIR